MGHTILPVMEFPRKDVRTREIVSGTVRYIVTVYREDMSAIYPGMSRYTVVADEGGRVRAVFRTNSYEYSPLVPLAAENVALETADEWERELAAGVPEFFSSYPPETGRHHAAEPFDLVVIQGSPRGDGNSSIIAGWAVEAAHRLKKNSLVIYPHDMDIHCCIGCYQCYNTGTCVFDDDMGSIIDAIRGASCLVICSPVYTDTVPAGLKLVLDRCQAYHAERALTGGPSGQKGLIFSVAGRKGEDNFTCVTRVLSAFLRNLKIEPAGEILIDSVDAVRDIRKIDGLQERVQELVRQNLSR
jgi:multimeric flavodoxin WrbA